MNMARAELLGWGIQVTYPNLTETSLTWALNKVLSDNNYNKNVRKVAQRLKDQPQTPMEKAMFWIEYVQRHDGAHFMQTSAQHLSFFEYNNLDIYATCIVFAFLTVFIPILVLKKLLKFICSFKKIKTNSKQKKKN